MSLHKLCSRPHLDHCRLSLSVMDILRQNLTFLRFKYEQEFVDSSHVHPGFRSPHHNIPPLRCYVLPDKRTLWTNASLTRTFCITPCLFPVLSGPPAVESSIAVEDVVENRSLYRVFVSRLFQRGLRHYSTTIARLSTPKRFRTRRLRTPTCVWTRDRAR